MAALLCSYQAGAEDLETSWGGAAITEAVATLAEVSRVVLKVPLA